MPFISSPGGTSLGGVSAVTGTPSAGQIIVATSGAAATWQTPVGARLSYVEKTTNTTISATTEGTANTIVTAATIVFDGSTVVLIDYYAAAVSCGTGDVIFVLYDDAGSGAASVGIIGEFTQGTSLTTAARLTRSLTPTAASHTYSVRAYRATANGTVVAGAGGSGAYMPTFICLTKAA